MSVISIHTFTLTCALACFTGFAWSIKIFFGTPKNMSPNMGLTFLLGGIFAFIHIALIATRGQSNPIGEGIGSVFYLLSLALFFWALKSHKPGKLKQAFTPGFSKTINRKGPYRTLRHPFYSAYTLAWIGGVFSSNLPWLSVTVIIMFGLYWNDAEREEKDFLSGPLANSYKLYQKRTGKFIPLLGTNLLTRILNGGIGKKEGI
jgi:protein-S-isoprenylcysteine O-methyltransferase Ste14